MTRNADALAEMFTADGVFEAPFASLDGEFPGRLDGREEIRSGFAAYYERSATAPRSVNADESRYVLHTTTDPDVFIAEIDTVLEGPAETVSLVQIFRTRDGQIAHVRDYFTPA